MSTITPVVAGTKDPSPFRGSISQTAPLCREFQYPWKSGFPSGVRGGLNVFAFSIAHLWNSTESSGQLPVCNARIAVNAVTRRIIACPLPVDTGGTRSPEADSGLCEGRVAS